MSNMSVKLPADAFRPVKQTSETSELITRPSLTFWADARRRLMKIRLPCWD